VIELKSFDIKILGDETTGYTLEAIGPAGERGGSAFDWRPIADLAADLQTIQEGRVEGATLQRLGSALFQGLFPMDVMMVYVAVKARLEENEGLRLRLHLPPELARLPWELLYYPPFFLATDPHSPVVRFLDLPDTPRPLAVQPPLRLLHLVAGPVDAQELNAEREADLLRSALDDALAQGAVEIIPAQPGTLAALREGLRQGVHILHFSGHGDYARDQGYLVFEDEDRSSQPVDAGTLAHLLRGTGIRLAVLNACESAQAGEGDAFASVAGALVRAGLPAVVAHQYAMPDSSAIAFATGFYGALAVGFPVDAAVSEGRRAVLTALGSDWQACMDWATPVLFMNAPDGRIFDLAKGEDKVAAEQPTTPGIYQQVYAQDDVASIGTISGGTVRIDFGSAPAASGPPEPSATEVDVLPGLLDQLRHTVRDHAPESRRARALEAVTVLRGAATRESPDLALLEAVLCWFEAELPALSGAVLSVVLALEPRVEQAGDELLWEFRQRFGQS
jgi:hypothetical protein